MTRGAASRNEFAGRIAARLPELEEIERMGYKVHRFNHGSRVTIFTGTGGVNFWPGTGRWQHQQTNQSGTLQDAEQILPLLRQWIGDPAVKRRTA